MRASASKWVLDIPEGPARPGVHNPGIRYQRELLQDKIIRDYGCERSDTDHIIRLASLIHDLGYLRSIDCEGLDRFLEHVRSIEGVVRVVVVDQNPIVYVARLRSEASRAVFRLETEINREFPNSRVDVDVEGLRELGIDESELDDEIPAGAQIVF